MGYDTKTWKRRLAERSDLSTQLVHLTREADGQVLLDVLFRILGDRKIKGSDPASAFLHGDIPTVCFQDAPLPAICQNIFYEQKYREQNPASKLRYRAAGLMFEKSYIFSAGGRPVIYDRPVDAKEYLPKNQRWRIVNFDLSAPNNIIDWTHEREWRIPGDFTFDISKVTVLLVNEVMYKSFIKRASVTMPGLLEELNGVVVMSHLLY